MNSANPTLLDWLAKIEQGSSCSIQLGLERVMEVGSKANLFNFDCPVVTIAGTNGKGSTLATLAMLLSAAGKKLGTYSSPHILNFNERIRINGEAISETGLCDAFAYIEALAKGIALTYFEFTTLAALYLFKQASLDILLLEIGLGGRLDAVNAVSPDLAIITSISYDHEAWLGNTLEEIAKEKAGILRPNIPAVLSHEACQLAVLEAVKLNNNKVSIENRDFGFLNGDNCYWKLKDIVIELPNNFLPINSVSLAMATYTILGETGVGLPSLSQSVKKLAGLGMVGRFHCVALEDKQFIFDVAHNGAGAKWLAERLSAKPKLGKRLGVWSSLADKSLASMVAPMQSQIDEWYVGALVGNQRSSSSEALKQVLNAKGIRAVYVFSTVKEAFLAAKENASRDDEIVVWGSFFTVAQGYLAAGLGNIAQVENGIYR